MNAPTSAATRTASRPDSAVRLTTADTRQPAVALLSNGRYGVMLTAAGAGYSSWRDMDVTRWREDGTRDNWGQFCYVRDLGEGKLWSVGHQPVGRKADGYEVAFQPWRVDFSRRDGDIETRMAVCVAADRDAEIRLVTVVNHGGRPRNFDLTSYAEVCLNHRRADQAHPTFAKLFLETEHLKGQNTLLCRRRPRAADQKPVWAVHACAANGQVEYQTDRARFLGRGRTPANPVALEPEVTLFGTTGPVLDPVFSLRCMLWLAAGAETRVAFVTGAADSRERAVALAEQYQTTAATEHAFDHARSAGEAELRELGLSPDDVASFNRLAGAVLFADPNLRSAEAAAANGLGQPGLWPYAISGDRPIVLAVIGAQNDGGWVRQVVQWHAYVRRRGMDLDLVILDERSGDTADRLKSDLQGGPAASLLGKPGGVFVVAAGKIADDGRTLIEAAARAVLRTERGSLADQLPVSAGPTSQPIATGYSHRPSHAHEAPVAGASPKEFMFWNGFGGFTRDGREYVIVIDGDAPGGPQLPPAPWINVVANPDFGFLATEAGSGYTWAGNSQMNRLTPWSNDPVSDPPGEAIYLRDEETGEFWTPTPLPRGAGAQLISGKRPPTWRCREPARLAMQ